MTFRTRVEIVWWIPTKRPNVYFLPAVLKINGFQSSLAFFPKYFCVSFLLFRFLSSAEKIGTLRLRGNIAFFLNVSICVTDVKMRNHEVELCVFILKFFCMVWNNREKEKGKSAIFGTFPKFHTFFSY